MALTAEQLEQYGLTQVDGGTKEDGVVQSGSNYYKVNNFERQSKEGLDTDQGDVFGSSLESDSGKSFTNFNTINDVQGAIQAMEGNAPKEKAPVQYSPELQAAHSRVNDWVERNHSGELSSDIFDAGYKEPISRGGYDSAGKQQAEAAQAFADGYMDKVKREITTEVDELNS